MFIRTVDGRPTHFCHVIGKVQDRSVEALSHTDPEGIVGLDFGNRVDLGTCEDTCTSVVVPIQARRECVGSTSCASCTSSIGAAAGLDALSDADVCVVCNRFSVRVTGVVVRVQGTQ